MNATWVKKDNFGLQAQTRPCNMTLRAQRLHNPRCNPGLTSFSAWANERGQILHQICSTIDRRKAAGYPVTRSVRMLANRWAGKHFRKSPGRKLRLSATSLAHIYYVWKRKGRQIEALQLRYRSPNARWRADWLEVFITACGGLGAVSLRRGYEWTRQAAWMADEVKGLGEFPGFEALRRRLPLRARKAIASLHAIRRQAARAEREFDREAGL